MLLKFRCFFYNEQQQYRFLLHRTLVWLYLRHHLHRSLVIRVFLGSRLVLIRHGRHHLIRLHRLDWSKLSPRHRLHTKQFFL
jgi:hypothetical protein